ncbi:unnamed protein product [Trichobilharzia regenti]|nr:unnamed protein product [Trichobilharzia regenti]
MDWEEVRVANERAERNLETLFEDRQRRELVLKSSELELKQVKIMFYDPIFVCFLYDVP